MNEPTLLDWVLEVVSGIDAGHGTPRSPDQPPLPTMLSVLTYCYATGLYESEEIETAARVNEVVRYLALHHFLTSVIIRQFRRRHRDLLRSCLLELHERAWEHRFGSSSGDRSRLAGRPGPGERREAVFTYRLNAEAEERIQRAVLADSMAMDV